MGWRRWHDCDNRGCIYASHSSAAQSLEKFRALTAKRAARLNVVIVWSGSMTFKDNKRRAGTLEQFMQLATIPGVQLFSLQKGPRETDLKALLAEPLVIDLAPHIDDFADTAAAVSALDLIVMTDSSVAHLAGSLGRPIINLLQYKPYWLYMPEQESTPWYPSMRLLRQPVPGAWGPVFNEASTFITAMASAHHRA